MARPPLVAQTLDDSKSREKDFQLSHMVAVTAAEKQREKISIVNEDQGENCCHQMLKA